MNDPGLFSPTSSACSSPVPVALPERQSILILGPNGTLEGTPLEIRPSVQPTIQQITPVQPPTIPATPVQPPQPPQALQDYNREGYFEPKLVRNKQIQPRCWELLLCSGKCTLSQYRKKKVWRLSRHEASTGFLARVAAASEIATYCPQQEAFNLSKGIESTTHTCGRTFMG
ncbi:uncharacterized protein LOC134671148 [Cydia fagiglandana]|uniref:uncharacterized protein LOC134671148 n=1 Tax=Cydia fagiglandana TaxID=1458189 RepID=UPI002FEDF9B4